MISLFRHAAYRAKYVYGSKLPLSSPVDVSMELSSACNMRCSYCYHGDKANLPFTMGMMTKETIDKIVWSAADARVPALKFNYRGESTLNPLFLYATTLAKSLAHESTFIERLTNSNFKFDNKREDIFTALANQTKVKISYDSFDKAIFEAQRTGGDHAVTTANIDKFYNWPGRTTRMVIQAVRTTANRDEDIAGLARKRWPSATISIRDMVAGRVEKDVSALENKTRDASERQTCIQAHVRLMFDWTGNAGVCCPDIKNELRAGDIYKNSVREIFNSRAAREIRRDLKTGAAFDRDPCKNCSSFESYKGFKPSWKS